MTDYAMRTRKKLIEVALPLDAINTASAREKSIRHGHPSTLHLWWARRPLAAARAVIFSQMVDDPSEYVDVLRDDPKLRRKAESILKARLAAWHEARDLAGKAEGSGTAAVLRAAWPEIEKVKARYPELRIGLAGQLAEASETNSNMMKMFLLTTALMFGLLVLLFNSYRLPFIILFSVPCALIGTLFGFLAIDMPLSFPAMVGIVSLLGIVVNVSIVMVETMREFIGLGRSINEAAAHGAADRLRPILSTTLTTIAGLALLSLSSPMWQPLCYAIIFGLVAATVLSFIVVPALFILLSPRTALR